MYVLITYDVQTTSSAGRKRLRHIAKLCENFGQRVQNSVFECELTEQELLLLKSRIKKEMYETEDSIRIYRLGAHYQNKVEHFGTKEPYKFDEAFIV